MAIIRLVADGIAADRAYDVARLPQKPDVPMPGLVTAGITCFNAAETIERAVMSALAQTWPEIEVIVVDDCSTDGSWTVLQGLAGRDPRIRITRHKQNKGYPAALNTILDAARGEFVSFFDDDDASAEDRVAAQIRRIESYERETEADLVFCYSNRSIVRVGEQSPGGTTRAIGRLAVEPSGPAVADFILGIDEDPRYVWGRFGSCTLTMRRSALMRLGPFDEQFRRSAEWDMAIRGAQAGAHFIAVDRPLITQYKTKTEDKAGTLPLRYALLLREKHRDYLDRKGLYSASRALAIANFHRARHHRARHVLFLVAAMLEAPSLLLLRLRRRVSRLGA